MDLTINGLKPSDYYRQLDEALREKGFKVNGLETNDSRGNGLKYDDQKTRWDLLPMNALEEVAKVYTFGASKYAAWNWRKGLAFSRCAAAVWRHWYAWWWKREAIDEESGCHHLAACAFYLLNFMCYELDKQTGLDDRPNSMVQSDPTPLGEEVVYASSTMSYRKPDTERMYGERDAGH